MEHLTLFTSQPTGSVETAAPSRLRFVSVEHLRSAETYLAEKTKGDVPAAIQAAMLICEGAGDVSRSVLDAVTVDAASFPRTAAALERTRELVATSPAEWPEGFWPRFLLGVLAGTRSPR